MKSLLAWMRPLAIILIVTALGIAAYRHGGGASTEAEEASVARNPGHSGAVRADSALPVFDEREYVSALGRVQPESGLVRIAPGGLVGGGRPRLLRLLVDEGNRVESGQVVAWLDNRERAARAVAQAEAQLLVAEKTAEQAGINAGPIGQASQEAAVDRLRIEHDNAVADDERAAELFQVGYISRSARDAARLKRDAAAQELRRAQALDRANRALTRVEAQGAAARVHEARANLARCRTEFELCDIRSPLSGTVLKVYARDGEEIGGLGIMEIGNTDNMYVVAQVYESDIRYVQIGDQARILSRSLSVPEITGRVEVIGLKVDRNDIMDVTPVSATDFRIVLVRIRLDDSRPVAGMTGLPVDVYIKR